MLTKKAKSIISACVFICAMLLILSSCKWPSQPAKRETIFDKIVHIPQDIVDVPYVPAYCDEIFDLKNGYADIKDGKLYYEEEGQGIPLVLINGGPGNTHHVFHPYFSQLKDVARVIYYDQRGTGKSSKDSTGKTYTVKQAVEDLESLRKTLKIDTWAVLGHSYGGLLAQCYALTYPEHCTGLILVSSDPALGNNKFYTGKGVTYKRADRFFSSKEWDAITSIRKKVIQGQLTSDAQVIYNTQLAGDWKNQYYYKPTKEELIRQALYNWNPAPDFRECIVADATINLQNKFINCKIPTLIIEGKWDFLWGDIDRTAVMHKNHPHAQIEVFEKSGHMIFADEPEKFFTLLKKFLKATHQN